MAEVVLDSDVVIWHLRGRESVVRLVTSLAGRVRVGISAVTRAEVLLGMRPAERGATLGFLDACETLAVDAKVVDLAAEWLRALRAQGTTIPLPDALIAATACTAGATLHTCNPRHYPFTGLRVQAVVP